MRKAGERIRITAQLVKAADGFHVWSETYDRTLDDIFLVQEDIARSVARELRVTLLGERAVAPRPDAEAYDLVLQAQFVLSEFSEESTRRGRAILERAIALAPDYAPAWAAMGLLHGREADLAATQAEIRQANERGRQALTKALELDPNLAVAHSRMALVLGGAWEFAEAERSAERALAADPKNPKVMGNLALIYRSMGRLQQASALLERALEYDPLNLPNHEILATSYLDAGRLDEAERLLKKGLELEPDWGSDIVGRLHLMRGEKEKARAAFARWAERRGQPDFWRPYFEAILEHASGNEMASAEAAAEFEKKSGADHPFLCACIRAWRGEADVAFAWLDKAYAVHDGNMARLKFDPNLRPLHTDPRWNALLQKIGLPTD